MKCWLTVLFLALVPAAVAATPDDRFRQLLAEAELVYRPPAGYVDGAPGRTPMLDYEKSLSAADGDLEIRIAVRPLQRLSIDYDDPHGSAPDPNHVFPLVFESLSSRLAGGSHAPSNVYPPERAREQFNADWAAASVFDTTRDFDTPYTQGLLLAIHRNKTSDAYLVFLFDDYARVKHRLKAALSTLTFATPEGHAVGDAQ